MPIISMFLGIIISTYYDDHMPPHFHAEYNGEEAVFNLDGDVITGGFHENKRASFKLGLNCIATN